MNKTTKKPKRDYSKLHTPEIRAKRGAAIREALRRKREREIMAAGLPIPLPTGERPVIQYEGEPRGRRPRSMSQQERIELAKGLIATVAMILKGGA